MKENKFVVNPDKQVWPCCYFANQGYIAGLKDWFNGARKSEDAGHEIMQKYWKHMDELNLKNNSIDDVLNHEWYSKTLPESWETNPHRLCDLMCGEHWDEKTKI